MYRFYQIITIMEIKTFDGFIKELTLEPGSVYRYIQDELREHFGDFCYDEMMEKHVSDKGFLFTYTPEQIITENLKSHNWMLLRKQLLKQFKDDILGAGLESSTKNNGELSYFIVKCVDAEKIKSNEKFIELLHFFNYFVTYKEKNDLYLEPRYSEIITIDDEYLYHLTSINNLNDIYKKGLLCKCGKKIFDDNGKKIGIDNYRDFPKRIYVFALKNETHNEIDKITSSLNTKNAIILKIKNSKNITLYKDVAYDENEKMFFTYDNIPPQLIVDKIDLV